MEHGLTPQRIVAELTRSPHGKLAEYVPVAQLALREQPEFLAHLIAWNEKNGQVRDSKVALPVVTLTEPFQFTENSLAHLALLDPRNLVRAIRFAKELGHGGRAIRRVVERYLRAREADPGRFVRTVIAHRASLATLYSMLHIKPNPWADGILFKGAKPPGPLADVARLKEMSPLDAASAIVRHRIPFLVAQSALGAHAKDTSFVLALIDQMSPQELLVNSKMLERLGIKTVPELRAAYDAGLKRVAESTKVSTLKASKAVERSSDTTLKAKLKATQEKQIAASGIDGDWLVLGDRSGSMEPAIEVAKEVAATLAKFVKGRVHLIFFDTMPRYIEVTGKSYDEVRAATKDIRPGGSTSIGCGVRYMIDRKLDVQGIAIVSDGGENATPFFAPTYQHLCGLMGVDVPVYLYWVGDTHPQLIHSMQTAKLDMQVLDLRGGVDYYSLPNLVKTMRVGRYQLFDDVMNTPLLTLAEVFKEGEQHEHAAA